MIRASRGSSLLGVYLATVKMWVAYFSMLNPSVPRQAAIREVRQTLWLLASAVFVLLLPNACFEISEMTR
jgi:hypothetical protein